MTELQCSNAFVMSCLLAVILYWLETVSHIQALQLFSDGVSKFHTSNIPEQGNLYGLYSAPNTQVMQLYLFNPVNAFPLPVGPPLSPDLQLETGYQVADIDPRNQLFYILALRNDSNILKEELLGLSLTNGQIVKRSVLHTIFGRAQYLNVNPLNGDVFVICNLTPNIHLFSLLKISFKGDQSNITILNHGFSGIGSNNGLSAFDFKNNVLVISISLNPEERPSLVALDVTTSQILKTDPNKGLMSTLTFDASTGFILGIGFDMERNQRTILYLESRTLQVRKTVYIAKLSTPVLFYGGSLDTERSVMYCFMSKLNSLEVDLVTIDVDTGKVIEASPVLILPQNLLVYNNQ